MEPADKKLADESLDDTMNEEEDDEYLESLADDQWLNKVVSSSSIPLGNDEDDVSSKVRNTPSPSAQTPERRSRRAVSLPGAFRIGNPDARSVQESIEESISDVEAQPPAMFVVPSADLVRDESQSTDIVQAVKVDEIVEGTAAPAKSTVVYSKRRARILVGIVLLVIVGLVTGLLVTLLKDDGALDSEDSSDVDIVSNTDQAPPPRNTAGGQPGQRLPKPIATALIASNMQDNQQQQQQPPPPPNQDNDNNARDSDSDDSDNRRRPSMRRRSNNNGGGGH